MDKNEILKRCLFIPCESKEALHTWIKVYLNFDMPDVIVHPESTSSPMDFIWEVYSKSRADNDPTFTRVMAYSSRDGYKTLSASILEVLLMAHCGRSTGHLAALEAQAGYALGYVKNFLSKPFLKEFVLGDNKREIELLRYEDPVTGYSYTSKEYKEFGETVQNQLVKHHNYIKIVICTKAGANGLHAPSMVIDEVDLAKNDGYEEAQLIPGPWGVKHAITTLVSTRKSSFGLVQKEIDGAEKSKLNIRHWNIIDVTEACPPERHRPDEPMVDMWVNDDDLAVIDEATLKTMEDKVASKYNKTVGYAGCKTCPLFAMCKTVLATKQNKSKSVLPIIDLKKPINHVIAAFQKVSPEMAQAQLMCRKPETTGLIYPKLSKEFHMMSANKMWEIVDGLPTTKVVTKEQLINLLIQRGARFYAGMDWGWTHDFAVVTAAVWGNYCFVVDSIAVPGLELDDKMVACEKLRPLNPTIYADPEDPASVMTFRRKGHFSMRQWTKDKGSVKAGIEIVRTKLKPAIGGTTLFFLKGDEACERLVEQVSKYHFKQDAQGNITDDPDKEQDDSCDALRYLVMNVFANKGKIIAAIDDNGVITGTSSMQSFIDMDANKKVDPSEAAQKEMQSIINGFLEGESEGLKVVETEDNKPKKKSTFIWDI